MVQCRSTWWVMEWRLVLHTSVEDVVDLRISVRDCPSLRWEVFMKVIVDVVIAATWILKVEG